MFAPSLGFRHKTLSFVIGLFLFAALISPGYSLGQTTQQPQILLTWQALSYAPANYQGKVLPGPGSIITASVEIIDQGKIADLSKNIIYWYLDGSLVGSGVGKKTVNVRAPNRALQETEIMVQIPGYKRGLLFKRIALLVASPLAVIEAPYAGRSFGSRSIAVKGVPYFFNVTDLSTLVFSWTVNGEPAPQATSTEGKTELVININPDARIGSTLNIGLTIQDPKEELYYGSKNVTLNLSK